VDGCPRVLLFDPLGEYLSPALRGFRLTNGGYREIEPTITPDGLQLTSEVLGLLLLAESGKLRLVNRATGERLLPPPDLAQALRETQSQAETLQAEVARLRAEVARLRGDQDT